MDRRIRWLGAVLLVCFAVLFLQLNNFQLREATKIKSKQPSTPCTPNPYLLPRGDIVERGRQRARLLDALQGRLRRAARLPERHGRALRRPHGVLRRSRSATTTGLESQYDQDLSQHYTSVDSLGQLFTQHKVVDDIRLNVSVSLQLKAAQALQEAELGQHESVGAVVALDPRTGAILAMYGTPTFDPNQLVVHSYKKVIANYNALVKQPGCNGGGTSPLNNGATSCSFLPGSTFKVVDTAAIFNHKPLLALKYWPGVSSIGPLPQSNQHLQNFGGEICPVGGGYLPQILAQSCDTAYAEVGMSLGAADLNAEATSFGFNSVPPIDLPTGEVAAADFPSVRELVPGGSLGTPGLAYSAIGQENVSATALQMALVAAGVANNGVIMTPHLLHSVTDAAGIVLSTYQPHPWRTVSSASTAQQVRKLMLGVTEPGGTANNVFSLPGVAAKTGTAETVGCGTDNWLIAMAPAPAGQIPSAVVAVVVPTPPNQNACISETTGATVAGPVANAVLNAVLAQQAAQATAAKAASGGSPTSSTTSTTTTTTTVPAG